MENTNSHFDRKLVNQFEDYLRIMIKVLEFYKSMLHELKMTHNLDFIFQAENVSSGEREKKVEYERHNSTDFHRVFTKIIAMFLAN